MARRCLFRCLASLAAFGAVIQVEIQTKFASKWWKRREARLWREGFHTVPRYAQEDLPCAVPPGCVGLGNVTLVTVAIGVDKLYEKALWANRQSYARRFCYEYCIFTHPFSNTRAFPWEKVLAVRHLLEHGRKNVMYVDADAVFIKPLPVWSFVDSFFAAGKDILWTADGEDCHDRCDVEQVSVNTGVFVSRNTPWTQQFWTRSWDDYAEWAFEGHIEQRALLEFRATHAGEFQKHCGIYGKEMNFQSWWGMRLPSREMYIYHYASNGGANDMMSKQHKYHVLLGMMQGIDMFAGIPAPA